MPPNDVFLAVTVELPRKGTQDSMHRTFLASALTPCIDAIYVLIGRPLRYHIKCRERRAQPCHFHTLLTNRVSSQSWKCP